MVLTPFLWVVIGAFTANQCNNCQTENDRKDQRKIHFCLFRLWFVYFERIMFKLNSISNRIEIYTKKAIDYYYYFALIQEKICVMCSENVVMNND